MAQTHPTGITGVDSKPSLMKPRRRAGMRVRYAITNLRGRCARCQDWTSMREDYKNAGDPKVHHRYLCPGCNNEQTSLVGFINTGRE